MEDRDVVVFIVDVVSERLVRSDIVGLWVKYEVWVLSTIMVISDLLQMNIMYISSNQVLRRSMSLVALPYGTSLMTVV